MTNIATVSLEEARKHYNETSSPQLKYFLESLFDKADLEVIEYTKKWEDLGYVNGFFIGIKSDIKEAFKSKCSDKSKSTFATIAQAKSSIALAQLTQVVHDANKRADWKADWSNEDQEKWCIVRVKNVLVISSSAYTFYPISFHSREAAEESLIKHEELWEDYYELSIETFRHEEASIAVNADTE